jgi:hypothetical protein
MEGALQLEVSNRLPEPNGWPPPVTGTRAVKPVISSEMVNERLSESRGCAPVRMRKSANLPVYSAADAEPGSPSEQLLTKMPHI